MYQIPLCTVILLSFAIYLSGISGMGVIKPTQYSWGEGGCRKNGTPRTMYQIPLSTVILLSFAIYLSGISGMCVIKPTQYSWRGGG